MPSRAGTSPAGRQTEFQKLIASPPPSGPAFPGRTNGIILRNRAFFFDLIFAAGSQTLLQLGADPNRLGAQLGVTAVLHTWTRDLRL